MNIKIIRTNSKNEDFKYLVKFLDKELSLRNGENHDFFHQFNGIDELKNCIIVYYNQIPVGIGAIKNYDEECMEVKRMFVVEEYRGKGIASQILQNLEIWIGELGFKKCILETGENQPEAISLYKKSGYVMIENYGQYKGIDSSICFEKVINI